MALHRWVHLAVLLEVITPSSAIVSSASSRRALSLRVAPRPELIEVDLHTDSFARLEDARGDRAHDALVKPIKIRGRNSTDDSTVSEEEGHSMSHRHCFRTEHVSANSLPTTRCPDECPVRGKDSSGEGYCNFVCVQDAEDCRKLDPFTTVADRDLGRCRHCHATGCEVCSDDGSERCLECSPGYVFDENGNCRSGYFRTWTAIFHIAGLLVAIIFIYIASLECRAGANQEACEHGLRFRSRSKLHEGSLVAIAENERAQPPRIWSLSTNLLTTDVAGPGMVLHFRFQVFVIIWALCVAAAWGILALVFDEELLWLGTRLAEHGTRRGCFLIMWGYETQQRLMHSSITFMFAVYVVSTIGVLAFGVMQLRAFQTLDDKETTMKDYAALCENLPIFRGDGDELVEDKLKKLFEEKTEANVVGVSMCWNFGEHADKLNECADEEIAKRQVSSQNDILEAKTSIEPSILRPGFLDKAEAYMIGCDNSETEEPVDINNILLNLETTSNAWVVFETEEERDRALEVVRSAGGVRIGDNCVTLRKLDAEPDTVLWENFAWVDQAGMQTTTRRVLISVSEILLALVLWTALFYLPYAWFVLAASHKRGVEPGFLEMFALNIIVILGNQIMYMVCLDAATRCHYRFSDNREAAYVVLYFFAVLFNVIIDLVVEYQIAYNMMIQANVTTHDGRPLDKIPLFERFETYAMQRELGARLFFGYCFPATFLTPFLVEPVVNVCVPYWLFTRLVRSHPECSSFLAEKALACMDMDATRYADILVDVGLACLIFYFPVGYIFWMFLAMAGCHILVLGYDHYRLLRATKACRFANMRLDYAVLLLWSIPIAFILASLWFRTNCRKDYYTQEPYLCMETGTGLFCVCSAVFLTHVVVHCCLATYVVPMFGKKEHPASKVPFSETAKNTGCTWFSANPIWCLRSAHIYKHEPPCILSTVGKEHLMIENPQALTWYDTQGVKAQFEDYGFHSLILGGEYRNESFRSNSQLVLEKDERGGNTGGKNRRGSDRVESPDS